MQVGTPPGTSGRCGGRDNAMAARVASRALQALPTQVALTSRSYAIFTAFIVEVWRFSMVCKVYACDRNLAAVLYYSPSPPGCRTMFTILI